MTAPTVGEVWRYDFLWHWQWEQGESEGRKTRPASLVAAYLEDNGTTRLFFLPLTTTPPDRDRVALQLPRMRQGARDWTPTDRCGSCWTSSTTTS